MTKYARLEDAKKNIDPSIVYQEMYQEMRRYRDYELTSSQWYTGFLVIILGAMITVKRLDPVILIFIIIVSMILTFGGVFSVIYAKNRHKEIRDWVSANYEPSWKKEKFKPDPKCVKPWMFIIVSQLILGLVNFLIAGNLLFSQYIFSYAWWWGW